MAKFIVTLNGLDQLTNWLRMQKDQGVMLADAKLQIGEREAYIQLNRQTNQFYYNDFLNYPALNGVKNVVREFFLEKAKEGYFVDYYSKTAGTRVDQSSRSIFDLKAGESVSRSIRKTYEDAAKEIDSMQENNAAQKPETLSPAPKRFSFFGTRSQSAGDQTNTPSSDPSFTRLPRR